MIFSARSAYLTCTQVAERVGVSRQAIARLCRMAAIYPIMKHGNIWLIAPSYVIAASAGIAGRPREKPIRMQYAKPGRPKGVKNKKPYPKGVKRPRKRIESVLRLQE